MNARSLGGIRVNGRTIRWLARAFGARIGWIPDGRCRMFRGWGVLVVLVAGRLLAQQEDPQHSRILRAEAEELFHEGRLAEAITRLDEAVKLDPKSPEPLLERARFHEFAHQADLALADYQAIIDLSPRCLDAWLGRGRYRLVLGDGQGALADLDRALTIEPQLTTGYFDLGRAYELLGQRSEAEKCYHAIADEPPPVAMSWAYCGEARLRLGEAAGAEAAWAHALKLDPKCESARFFRARVRFDSRRLEEALKDLEASEHGIEEPGEVLLLLHYVYWGLERRYESFEARKAALRWDRTAVMRDLDAAQKAAGKEDPSKLVERLSSILARDGRCLPALHYRAVFRSKAGDTRGALADLDAVVAYAPHQSEVRFERSRTRQALGDAKGALEDLDEILRVNPGHTLAALYRAQARFDLGDLDGALADLETAKHHYAGTPLLWDLRGRIRERKGQLVDAVEDWVKAVKLKPDDWAILARKGLAEAKLSRPESGIKDLEAALRLAPEDWEGRAEAERAIEGLRALQDKK